MIDTGGINPLGVIGYNPEAGWNEAGGIADVGMKIAFTPFAAMRFVQDLQDPSQRVPGSLLDSMTGGRPMFGQGGVINPSFGGDNGYYGGNASGGLGGGGLFSGFGLFGGTPTDMAYDELNYEGGNPQNNGGGSTSSSSSGGGYSGYSGGGGFGTAEGLGGQSNSFSDDMASDEEGDY